MTAKDSIASAATVVLLFLVRVSVLEPIDPDDLSKEQKQCLFECLACVEVWGHQYDGETCAKDCVKTNGESIDLECKFGVFVSKRYKEMRAMDECKKQCGACTDKLKAFYSGDTCIKACDETRGKSLDRSCTKHMNIFDILAKYQLRQ